jgi:drug/metabolite transporter (DMT)-like permease
MPMSRTSGHVDGLVSGATWGLAALLLARPAVLMSGNPPLAVSIAIAAIHDFAAMLLLLVRAVITGTCRHVFDLIVSRRALVIVACSVLGGPLFMGGYTTAVVLAGPSYALTATATYPVFGAIFARWLLHQKSNRIASLGVAAAVVGAGLTTFGASLSTRSTHILIGVAIAAVAAAGLALEGVVAARAMVVVDAEKVLLARELFATILLAAALAFLPAGISTVRTAVLTPGVDAPIIAAGLVGGCSYLAWYRSIRKIGAARAMALNITYAMWGILFAWVFANETTGPLTIAGCVVVTVGAMLTIISGKQWKEA